MLPKVSKYDQEIAQSYTADNLWHRKEEPQNIYSNKTSDMVVSRNSPVIGDVCISLLLFTNSK